MPDREEFHFIGVVEKSTRSEVETSNGKKHKLDVYAVGAGPDVAVQKARRVSLWETRKDGSPQSWLELLRGEIAIAAGIADGNLQMLRFSGTRTEADRGGYYYDGNKVEVYDAATHGSSPNNGGGTAPASPGAASTPGAGAGDPAVATLSDALRAAEILLPRMPTTWLEEGASEPRPIKANEAQAWLSSRTADLLRTMRGVVVQVNSEPRPEPIRTNSEERS